MKGGCGPPRLAGLAGESAASPVPDRRFAQWEPLPSRFRADSTRGLAKLGRAAGARPLLQRGLGGAPEGGRLPSNGAVARRVPGLGEREL